MGMVIDVRTRWNSTILMLERTIRKKSALKKFCQKHPKFVALYPTTSEWKQIEYVIKILHPFYIYTKLLSSTRGPTIHQAWAVYNRLFEHLKRVQRQLWNKVKPWKQSIAAAIDKAIEKLSQYYGRTTGSRGLLYNLGNILNP